MTLARIGQILLPIVDTPEAAMFVQFEVSALFESHDVYKENLRGQDTLKAYCTEKQAFVN